MLEPPPEWTLNPADIETITLQEGEYLFKPGDPDDSVYVVLEGGLSVIITVRFCSSLIFGRSRYNNSSVYVSFKTPITRPANRFSDGSE